MDALGAVYYLRNMIVDRDAETPGQRLLHRQNAQKRCNLLVAIHEAVLFLCV